MTVRARAVLHCVRHVFAPARRPEGPSYALDIAGHLLDPARQQVTVLPFPTPAEGWQAHVARMVAALADGDAAFLVEGDPLLYGSWIDALRILQTDYPAVPVCIVPGVTSFAAAAAAAAVPLVDEDERLAVLPAMHALDDLPVVLARFDTLALLKVAPVLPAVLDRLDAVGLSDRVVHVRRVGRPEQQVLVGTQAIRSAPAAVTSDYFSLLIVHSTRDVPARAERTRGAVRGELVEPQRPRPDELSPTTRTGEPHIPKARQS